MHRLIQPLASSSASSLSWSFVRTTSFQPLHLAAPTAPCCMTLLRSTLVGQQAVARFFAATPTSANPPSSQPTIIHPTSKERRRARSAARREAALLSLQQNGDKIVLSSTTTLHFYRFFKMTPAMQHAFRPVWMHLAKTFDIMGTFRVSHEGVNCGMAGPPAHVRTSPNLLLAGPELVTLLSDHICCCETRRVMATLFWGLIYAW
jgi:hypothetical protein